PTPDEHGPDQTRFEPAQFAPARLEPARPAHRRVLLPVSILASAAAVVAAGAIGGTVGSIQPAVNQPAAVNLAPGLIAGQDRTSPQAPGTGPSFTGALGAGLAGAVIQPVSLRAGARFPSTP